MYKFINISVTRGRISKVQTANGRHDVQLNLDQSGNFDIFTRGEYKQRERARRRK
jgi:phage gp45-like